MRRTIPLLLAALLLTGCAAQNAEDAYVAAVTDDAPQILERGTKSELAELGVNVCEYIDGGRERPDIISEFVDAGFSPVEASTAVDRAVEIICP